MVDSSFSLTPLRMVHPHSLPAVACSCYLPQFGNPGYFSSVPPLLTSHLGTSLVPHTRRQLLLEIVCAVVGNPFISAPPNRSRPWFPSTPSHRVSLPHPSACPLRFAGRVLCHRQNVSGRGGSLQVRAALSTAKPCTVHYV